MQLGKIFSSHMVFAADRPIRIYGDGDGCAKITFKGEQKSVSSTDGKWYVEFAPEKYGGPYTLCAEFEDRTVTLEDIFVGEVYLFAGQSNIQYKICESGVDIARLEAEPRFRIYSTDRIEKSDRYTADDGWLICEKENIEYLSAIAYYTCTKVAKEKNIAVGAIACYQGASVIESWVPCGSFEAIGINIPIDEKRLDHTYEPFLEWNRDGTLYEYALSQVTPFSLSEVVWYQGESDTTSAEAAVYLDELRELIRIWREDFGDPALRFVVVQLADLVSYTDEGWHILQEAQLDAEREIENVRTVISRDVCENDDIHPRTKDKLSHRIADVLLS